MYILFHSFYYLAVLGKTSRKMLNRSIKKGHLFLIPDHKGNHERSQINPWVSSLCFLCCLYSLHFLFHMGFFLSEIDIEFHQKLFCIYWCIHRVLLFLCFKFCFVLCFVEWIAFTYFQHQTSLAFLWPSPPCRDLLFFLCIARFDLLHFRLFWAQIYSRVWY